MDGCGYGLRRRSSRAYQRLTVPLRCSHQAASAGRSGLSIPSDISDAERACLELALLAGRSEGRGAIISRAAEAQTGTSRDNSQMAHICVMVCSTRQVKWSKSCGFRDAENSARE